MAVQAKGIGALAAVLALMAAPASAAVMVATYTGTVSGRDRSGAFGAVADWNGAAFQLTYTYDTALGQNLTGAGIYEEIRGGSSFGAYASPILSTRIKIGSYELVLGPSSYLGQVSTSTSEAFNPSWKASGEIYHLFKEVIDTPTSLVTNTVESGGVASFSDELDDTGSKDVDGFFGDPTYEGELRLYEVDRTTNQVLRDVEATFFTEHVDIRAAAVPEPSTWAMLLLGFFGLGGALRTQRRRLPVPA